MQKFSIFSWFGYPIPMDERFRLIKQVGFNSTCLWWADDNIGDDGDKNRLPDLARKYGLEVENIHTPFSNVNSLWEDNLDGDD